jgi:hypothetical protein
MLMPLSPLQQAGEEPRGVRLDPVADVASQ